MQRIEIQDDRSIPDLIKDLRDETTKLMRQEVALAKTELSEKAAKIVRNSLYLGIGGGIAFAGLLFILVGVSALVYVGLVAMGLSHMTAGWVAPLLVGVVLGLIGYAFIQKGISTLKREPLVPEKTVQSLQENKQWLQEKMS